MHNSLLGVLNVGVERSRRGRIWIGPKNSKGASRAPWGTPEITVTFSEVFLFVTTLSDREETNHRNILQSILYDSHFV